MKDTITIVLIVAVVALLGYMAFFKASPAFGSSAVGTTFNSAKVAEIVMQPTSSSATSSSILNTDANDRIIDSSFVSCATSTGSVFAQTAAGVATFQWQFATTSTNAPAVFPSTATNAALINLGTSTTDDSYAASSTPTARAISRRWPTGTYLTIQPNATSSNASLSCQAGVYYHGT